MLRVIAVFFIFIFLNACSSRDVQAVFQTNGASIVREHTYLLERLLLSYYEKLNKRNPSYTTKIERIPVIYDIQNHVNNATLPILNYKKNATYKEYLNIAFSRNDVANRNDYLIAGIYKMFYWAYDVERSHTVTAIQYDAKKLQEANEMMQIIQYRVEHEKDKNGNYLFLTWQQPWQVELLKSIYQDNTIDLNLYPKEELMRPSNFEFRIITEGMIFTIQESLRYLGKESSNLGTSVLQSVFVFI
jgi:hypothetical protein